MVIHVILCFKHICILFIVDYLILRSGKSSQISKKSINGGDKEDGSRTLMEETGTQVIAFLAKTTLST